MTDRSPLSSEELRRSAGRLLSDLLAFFPPYGLGRRGESAAARFLRRQGLRVIARNFRARSGEIDIVALDAGTLVFVEVKSTLLAERGDPLDRISPMKARRIRRAAALCLRLSGRGFDAFRIDGVAVEFVPGSFGRAIPARIRWYPALYPMDDRE